VPLVAAATRLLALAAIALAAASSAVPGMLALTALIRIPLIDVPGKMSGQVISRDARSRCRPRSPPGRCWPGRPNPHNGTTAHRQPARPGPTSRTRAN